MNRKSYKKRRLNQKAMYKRDVSFLDEYKLNHSLANGKKPFQHENNQDSDTKEIFLKKRNKKHLILEERLSLEENSISKEKKIISFDKKLLLKNLSFEEIQEEAKFFINKSSGNLNEFSLLKLKNYDKSLERVSFSWIFLIKSKVECICQNLMSIFYKKSKCLKNCLQNLKEMEEFLTREITFDNENFMKKQAILIEIISKFNFIFNHKILEISFIFTHQKETDSFLNILYYFLKIAHFFFIEFLNRLPEKSAIFLQNQDMFFIDFINFTNFSLFFRMKDNFDNFENLSFFLRIYKLINQKFGFSNNFPEEFLKILSNLIQPSTNNKNFITPNLQEFLIIKKNNYFLAKFLKFEDNFDLVKQFFSLFYFLEQIGYNFHPNFKSVYNFFNFYFDKRREINNLEIKNLLFLAKHLSLNDFNKIYSGNKFFQNYSNKDKNFDSEIKDDFNQISNLNLTKINSLEILPSLILLTIFEKNSLDEKIFKINLSNFLCKLESLKENKAKFIVNLYLIYSFFKESLKYNFTFDFQKKNFK